MPSLRIALAWSVAAAGLWTPLASSQEVAPPPADSTAEAAELPGWRRENHCGVNCLYVMMKMQNIPCSYEELCGRTAVTDQGSSMLELARVARLHGLPLTPVSSSSESIAGWPLPAVVHFQQAEDFTGHYVLYLGRKNDLHRVLDCTSGELVGLSDGDFLSKWSGYVLLRSGPAGVSSAGWVPWAWLAAGLGIFGTGLHRWSAQRRRSAADPSHGEALGRGEQPGEAIDSTDRPEIGQGAVSLN